MSQRERDPTVEIEKEIYKKIKKLSSNNRKNVKQFVNDSLFNIINNINKYDNQEINNKTSNLEDEVKKLKNQTKESQEMILMMIHTIYKNKQTVLSDEILNIPISQKFKKINNLIGKKATENEMIIYDESTEKDIKVFVNNNFLVCSKHGKEFCNHISYATMQLSFYLKMSKLGINIPGDDEVLKKILEKIEK